MIRLIQWLQRHTFKVHLIAFCFLILPPALLFFAAQADSVVWIWALLGLVILGNLLAIIVK